MIGLWEAALGFAFMLGLMFLGFHVAVVMFAVGLLGAALTIGSPIVLAALFYLALLWPVVRLLSRLEHRQLSRH